MEPFSPRRRIGRFAAPCGLLAVLAAAGPAGALEAIVVDDFLSAPQSVRSTNQDELRPITSQTEADVLLGSRALTIVHRRFVTEAIALEARVRDGRMTAQGGNPFTSRFERREVGLGYGDAFGQSASPPRIDLSAYRSGGLRYDVLIGPGTVTPLTNEILPTKGSARLRDVQGTIIETEWLYETGVATVPFRDFPAPSATPVGSSGSFDWTQVSGIQFGARIEKEAGLPTFTQGLDVALGSLDIVPFAPPSSDGAFSDRAAFDAATSGLARFSEGFEAVDGEDRVAGPSLTFDSGWTSVVVDPSRIRDGERENGVRSGVLNIALDGLGETAHSLHEFILPEPVVAFGADWIGLRDGGLEDVQVQVGASEGEDPAFLAPVNLSELLAGSGGFAGIVSDTPFDRLVFTSASPTQGTFNAFSLDDAVFVLQPVLPPLPPGPRAGDVAVPLPAPAALMLAGLGALAGLKRRRRG